MKTENIDLNTLESLSLTQLREIANELNVEKASTMRKKELVEAVKEKIPAPEPPKKQDGEETVKNIPAEGILEILPDGFGFLRAQNCYNSDKDVYVSSAFIRRAGMRPGDKIKGLAQLLHVTEKHPSLYQIDSINDKSYEFSKRRPRFSTLVPVHPNEKIRLVLLDHAVISIKLLSEEKHFKRAAQIFTRDRAHHDLLLGVSGLLICNHSADSYLFVVVKRFASRQLDDV